MVILWDFRNSGGKSRAWSRIRGIISSQIEAFQRDDGATAYGYASSTIQGLFPSVDQFMAMVRSGSSRCISRSGDLRLPLQRRGAPQLHLDRKRARTSRRFA